MMKQSEADRLAKNLEAKFGLPLKALVSMHLNEHVILLQPEGIHVNEGFQVQIKLGWRSLYIDLILGKFAGDFLQHMAGSSSENKHTFTTIVKFIIEEKGVINFYINEVPTDPLKSEDWPKTWKFLKLSLKRSPLEINTENHQMTEDLINTWVERFFGCVISLSPLEEIEVNNEIVGLPEGSVETTQVNRYERSRFNRAICINFHGNNCKVCGMNFKEVYGQLGEGFIHVHHKTPVSQMGGSYILDPLKDLIPVCPNCHSMLHKREIPYSVEELKQIAGF